jgi:nicotinate-nucleotide pyrophosphorylase (carboxylating)
MPDPLHPADIRDLVDAALAEDVGAGDVTTRAIVPTDVAATGVFISKAPSVVAGLDVARDVFARIDPDVVWEPARADGDVCLPGDTLATVRGRAASLLTAERTALNFLQYMSGIATLTREFVAASGGRIQILDTRKTTPGLRALAKYAVRCGGGVNHRTGLYDGVLIKDNHIRIAGGIAEAVRRVRDAGITLPIEVEAQSAAEVDDAIAAGADTIMLDNLDDEAMRTAIATIRGRARVEISGGITLSRVRAIAELGADCVSVGALTHSARAADISLEIETGA